MGGVKKEVRYGCPKNIDRHWHFHFGHCWYNGFLDDKFNYMTVPAALRELEKIELIRQPDHSYRLDHAVTKTQKEILKVFNMTARNIAEQATAISDDLQDMTTQEAS